MGQIQFLEPLTSEIKKKPFVVFDLESKHEDTQKAGFTRPFMVGFYDGNTYRSFRNAPHTKNIPWYVRAISPGGCISQFMWHLLDSSKEGRSRFAGYDVFAHNMGGFDGLFLPAWLERSSQQTSYKIMPIQGKIQSVEVWRYNPARFRGTPESRVYANRADRKKYGFIRILDSYRIMPTALDKIARAFGLAGKLKDMDLDTPEDDPIWEQYNKIDCIQLYQTLEKYYNLIYEKLGGEVGITAPSTAIKLLRRQYLPQGTKIARNVHFMSCRTEGCLGCAHAFFRAAYYGGRTEIYQRKGKGYYYDVNSSYPYSMTLPQPTEEMIELEENEDFRRYAKDPNYIGFIRCTVDIPSNAYLPPLPVQHGGKLKFPAGRFSGTWDWTELKVLDRIGGKILHVEKSVWIKGTRFLKSYVERLYSMRKKGHTEYKGPALSEVAKIALNSTFGKFGMDQERIEMIILKPGEEQIEEWELRKPGESDDHREKRKIAEKSGNRRFHIATPLPGESDDAFRKRAAAEKKGDYNQIRTPDLGPYVSGIYEHDSLVRIKDVRVDAPYIIPQIAAHITASSRVLLWEFSMAIIDRGFHVFYSDTDSILTNFSGFTDSKELGGLKKEFDEIIEIECFAPKMYRMRKATPFDGCHARDPETSKLLCQKTCKGCLLDDKGAIVPGKHGYDAKGRIECEKRCPGCGCEKIMMKGFPKKYKTSEVLARLQAGEEIEYEQHEKLGSLAKRGFRDTPKMTTIKKSLKTKYDKRIFVNDNDTRPIVFNEPEMLSDRFREVEKTSYQTPAWLVNALKIYQPPTF